MECGAPVNTSELPTNAKITSLPSATLDFEDALLEVTTLQLLVLILIGKVHMRDLIRTF